MKTWILGWVVLGLVMSTGPLYAEDETDGAVGVFDGASLDTVDPEVAHEVEKLRDLKRQDPEAFREAIQEKRARLKERLGHLKEENPEAYDRVLKRHKTKRRHRLARLK